MRFRSKTRTKKWESGSECKRHFQMNVTCVKPKFGNGTQSARGETACEKATTCSVGNQALVGGAGAK